MRLLLLDNHQVFADTVAKTVLRDHDVVVVGSVHEGLVAALREPFDAVLVDYDLDGEKGDRFIERARKAGVGCAMIATSARPEGNEALLDAGATHRCAKLDFGRLPELLARLARARFEA